MSPGCCGLLWNIANLENGDSLLDTEDNAWEGETAPLILIVDRLSPNDRLSVFLLHHNIVVHNKILIAY